jgi:orotate phosphoribosyltransferase
VTDEFLSGLPVEHGHFRLESGYHSELWISLDTLFVSPHQLRPTVTALARRLALYQPTSICGPLLGGAFLAHALAMELAVKFFYAEPVGDSSVSLFSTKYKLPEELRQQVRSERVAVVDDVISAGSSVRATHAELVAAGASVVVIGALALLGSKSAEHFQKINIPMEVLARRDFAVWAPEVCPLCQQGVPVEERR